MKKIGVIKNKKSKEITQSKIGIGFECLDREMWDDTDIAYELVGELGVKHARIQSGWSRCEKEKGKYDFSWLDRTVDTLRLKGIQPWMCLCYGNVHYTEGKTTDSVGWPPIHSFVAREGWTNFIAALVKHMGERVTDYEIWNEPDHNCFWQPKALASEYVELVKLTVPTIKKYQPQAQIIGGTAFAAGINNIDFTQECVRNSILDYLDVFTYHFYCHLPEWHSEKNLLAFCSMMKDIAPSPLKIWQGETGSPSANGEIEACKGMPYTEAIQAKYALRRIVADLGCGMDLSSYFTFSDFKHYYKNGLIDKPCFFGTVSADDPPRKKEIYFALQRLCSVFGREMEPSPETMILLDYKENAHILFPASKYYGFSCNGYGGLAWWFPRYFFSNDPLYELTKNQDIEIKIWRPQGLNLKKPVMIDFMTGEVFRIDNIQNISIHSPDNGVLKIENIPIKDYPLFITDIKAIEDIIEPVD